MEETWHYVTPGAFGLPEIKLAAKGMLAFAGDKGIKLKTRQLAVPLIGYRRPKKEDMLKFLEDALQDDLPIAFLNLHNGNVGNLESYHWVCIVAYDAASGKVIIYDHGKRLEVDIVKWLEQTKAGGGFVAIE